MKTKFLVNIHKSGTRNDSILQIIALHNEGINVITMQDLLGYLTCTKGLFQYTSELSFQIEDNSTVYVFEREKPTLTISLVEIKELKENVLPLN